ncbi:MAG: hypothetical protein J5I59_05430 [Saprospiraceae bacterium]|nr:hypothetical protein [Saprospiraceae bacterium]
MKRRISILGLFLPIILFSISCNKVKFNLGLNPLFCIYIHSEDYNNVAKVINDFCSKQNPSTDDAIKLKQLEIWLKNYDCLTEVSIVCNPCIYTYPAKSEIKISYINDNQIKIKHLDILMSRPLKMTGIHD